MVCVIIMDFAIRLDLKHDNDIPDLVELLNSFGGSYWIVREGSTANPHVHVHLRCEKKLPAVRKSLQRKFPDHQGNGGYSAKECEADVTGYDRYMAKGDGLAEDPIIIGRHGLEYTDEAIKEWHVEYWNVNAELMRKRRKKLAGNYVDQLLQRCLDKGYKKRGLIANEFINMILEANKPLNTFAGKATINTVWLKLCPDDEARQHVLVDLVGIDADQARAAL